MSDQLRENDVVRYQPDNTWCREGLAIACLTEDGQIVLRDTYWHSDRQTIGDVPFEVLFNLDDYEPAERWTWDRRAAADRQVVTHQHGLQRDWYVRKGSVESSEQILANARAELAEAEEAVRMAEFSRDGARRYLDSLLASSGGAL